MREKINPKLIKILKLCNMTENDLRKKHALYLLLHDHKDSGTCKSCQFAIGNYNICLFIGGNTIRTLGLCICDRIPKLNKEVLDELLQNRHHEK